MIPKFRVLSQSVTSEAESNPQNRYWRRISFKFCKLRGDLPRLHELFAKKTWGCSVCPLQLRVLNDTCCKMDFSGLDPKAFKKFEIKKLHYAPVLIFKQWECLLPQTKRFQALSQRVDI